MCGIVVLGNFKKSILELDEKIVKMGHLLKYRGPDDKGYYFDEHAMMAHHRLSIIDLSHGKQPISYTHQDITYHICFNGEIYNMKALKEILIEKGYPFYTDSDTEVLLVSYIEWKEKCLDYLEGIFAFVISNHERLFIARDQMGVKPLFYYEDNDTIVIASEIKCILSYIGKAVVDKQGIKELLGLGPSVTPGRTIYKDIYSLRPAHYMYYDDHIEMHRYWSVKDEEHLDTFNESVKKVRELVEESTKLQLLSDVGISTMLSGGLDSSILTAITCKELEHITTYSVSYKDQKDYFQSYVYQTTMDDDYIDMMVDKYHTDHHFVELSQEDLVNSLEEALLARDMPGMADIDSSLLLFSKEIAKNHKVCLSGECADEIFGGYPWFYKEELYNQPYFPWMRDIDKKLDLFHEDIKALNIKDYIIERYNDTLNEINTDDKKKQILYLNLEWFMQTLLTRCDSQTMRSSIEVRVPFASTKIIQYLYNMPIEYMLYGDEEKGLLRKAFEDVLPKDIVHRKKNPYPKTHSPLYTKLICAIVKESLNDSSNILYRLFDKDKLLMLIESEGKSLKNPWFGQLMMGPQLIAYLYQIYLWGKVYHIELELE